MSSQPEAANLSKGIHEAQSFFFRRSLKVLGVVGVLGVVSYGMRRKKNNKVSAQDWNERFLEQFDTLPKDPTAFRKLNPLFYRYLTCPFCGKAQTFLDLNGVNYSVTEVDPLNKRELRPTGYGKVPQLEYANGARVVDSLEIVNRLAPIFGLQSNDEIEKWRDWTRLRLVKHLVVQVNSSLLSSAGAFGYVKKVDGMSFQTRMLAGPIGGTVMWLVAKYKSAPDLGLKKGDDAWGLFMKELDEWAEAVKMTGKGGAFHGGKKPDLADIEVFGALRSVITMPLWEKIAEASDAGTWMKAMRALPELKAALPTE
eukprot:NODE_965_length_1088_cov_10.560874_g921_i0.p1 GENE.NODE_965_length_1088_cov_10.560874_g921_i0~~NODE_965_length_1088_cov_10.560874_g921_i0.p1  ORF type:complete len:312 (+),score=53.67 NODE_965_length_1088_cov_10.560874_g921_i0:115-1050(+)